ncbi:MAG: hypothetical protein ACK559_15450, partial [bacterium]
MVVRLPEPVGALYPEGFFGDFVVQTIPSPTTFTTYSPGIDAGPLLGPNFTAYILAANNPNADHVYFQQAENSAFRRLSLAANEELVSLEGRKNLPGYLSD